MLATKVLFPRLGSNGAKLFFAIALGEGDQWGLIIRDVVLRESNNGKGDYTALPSKPRLTKDGPGRFIHTEKEGKPIYDQVVDLYYEGEGDARKVTGFSWDLREQIIKQAGEAFAALSTSETGRGPAAMPTQAPAGVATTTGGTAPKGMFDNDDDDRLLF